MTAALFVGLNVGLAEILKIRGQQMLTDTAIRVVKGTPGKTVKLSDGGGLQLWVRPSGAKLWNLAYRFGAKQKKLSLGQYLAIGLKDAREKREAAKKTLASGRDPGQEKQIRKANARLSQGNTFAALSAELIEKKEREGKAPATIAKIKWMLRLATPFLGPRPIAEINAPEVLVALREAETRGKLETARRMRAVIGETFRYAIATGRAENDPTFALRGALITPKVKHRPAITETVPFGALLRAIDGYDGTPEVRLALKLLSLTFTRPGELRNAEWAEFDLDAGIWTIPAGRMKMRRPHSVPLAHQSVAILRQLGTLHERRTLLFPGARSPKRPMSENTLNAALRRLGYGQHEMTSHGFRAAASSLLNESGKWNPDAIEAQLAHIESNKVRKAYARAEYWDERVLMMTWWANQIEVMKSKIIQK